MITLILLLLSPLIGAGIWKAFTKIVDWVFDSAYKNN